MLIDVVVIIETSVSVSTPLELDTTLVDTTWVVVAETTCRETDR